MEVWGFPWETLEAYRQVRHLDPARTDLVERGEIYAKLMRTPLEVSKD